MFSTWQEVLLEFSFHHSLLSLLVSVTFGCITHTAVTSLVVVWKGQWQPSSKLNFELSARWQFQVGGNTKVRRHCSRHRKTKWQLVQIVFWCNYLQAPWGHGYLLMDFSVWAQGALLLMDTRGWNEFWSLGYLGLEIQEFGGFSVEWGSLGDSNILLGSLLGSYVWRFSKLPTGISSGGKPKTCWKED